MTRILAGQWLQPYRLNEPGWTTYTPTWTAQTTNPVLNNGTLQGRWRYDDDDEQVVDVWIILRPGSTTTFGAGGYRFNLPVPTVAGGPDPVLSASLLGGGQLYPMIGWVNASVTAQSMVSVYRVNNTAAEPATSWTNAAPVAFASGHTFTMYGRYRVGW